MQGSPLGTVFGKAIYTDMGAWRKVNPTKKLRIYSWNVNGIKAIIKKDEFKTFLKDADPDILCLNETKTDLD